MSYDIVYTSCSINQIPGASHWGKNNLICFGSSNAVRIYDPWFGSGGKITNTLYGHSKLVTSTRWLTGKVCETELISGCAEGKVIVWSQDGTDFVPQVLCENGASIIVADGCYKNHNTEQCIFAISTSDNLVKIYQRDLIKDGIISLQNVDLGKHVAMTLKFSHLPLTNVMFIGLGTDTGIFMLYADDKEGKFHKHTEINAHAEWIRGIDFKCLGEDLLFATASQDTLVKVWRIKACEEDSNTRGNFIHNNLIRKNARFRISDTEYMVNLDTVLQGHDSWLYSVNFSDQHLELMLSTSVDKNMIVWRRSEESKWIEIARFGEIGSSNLGYLGGMFGPKGDIFAHGFFGSFHLWKYSSQAKTWTPAVTLGGHSKEVVDLAWEPLGQFLYSASRDQTTRIHAPWSRNHQITTWHEIARPQIHGYEMTCLALLSRYEYAAGAEEKVIRTFKAPRNFIENFRRICKISNEKDVELNEDCGSIPQGAALSSLGLSNKAIYEGQDVLQVSCTTSFEQDSQPNFVPVTLSDPPTEEDLLQNTLWPETHKLYGHGYEIFALAATNDGSILASACKATTREHASILLWSTSTWMQLDKLQSHNLTVTQLAFSHDSTHLLSVSRDRRWTLFSLDSISGRYKIFATTDSRTAIHTRIIWCCTWLYNSKYFATGSRDGKVVIWKEIPNPTNSDDLINRYCAAGPFLDLKGESITAITSALFSVRNLFLLAVGLDSGIIHLYLWDEHIGDNPWQLFITIGQRDAHHKTVKRLAFRNTTGKAGCSNNSNYIQLASCGADCAVRVYDIKL